MGAGIHGGFGKTFGAVKAQNLLSESKLRYSKQKKEPIFTKTGHVTDQSISARAEFFLGKSVAKLENVLHRHGYETVRRPSK